MIKFFCWWARLLGFMSSPIAYIEMYMPRQHLNLSFSYWQSYSHIAMLPASSESRRCSRWQEASGPTGPLLTCMALSQGSQLPISCLFLWESCSQGTVVSQDSCGPGFMSKTQSSSWWLWRFLMATENISSERQKRQTEFFEYPFAWEMWLLLFPDGRSLLSCFTLLWMGLC